ncbi:hypothetical protein Fmac_005479 [Flemingia macrophylla]|uniref:Uncharacterized protein n=1 Tax=Flemingia macrophylla TaxID=520843 RepID=A0ABD1N7Y6_9FABA
MVDFFSIKLDHVCFLIALDFFMSLRCLDRSCKGGIFKNAQEVFQGLLTKDIRRYNNVMINELCQEGLLEEAFTSLAINNERQWLHPIGNNF